MTTTLALRNNNLALAAKPAARAAATALGTMMISPTGAKLFWTGADWVFKKAWNRIKRGFSRRQTDLVTHPGALSGAIAAPVAVTRIIRGSKPKFQHSKGSVTVTHRELVGQFNNLTTFGVNPGNGGNGYALNPSNPLLFPWLQPIATNFDQYKFDSVRLQYVPLCATTETGRVALYFDKDSQDDAPADRVELANMAHLRETAPWAESSLNIPVDSVKRFVNDNTTADRKLVDLGQIGLAVYGGGGTNPVGDLFIHYTVTFFEPQPSAGVIETEQIGLNSVNSGPDMFSVGGDAISTVVTFKTPGTFIVAVLQRNTTLAAPGTSGLTINSSTNAQAVGFYIAVANVTVVAPGGILQHNGTGFGNRTVFVTRAKKSNVVNLI